MFLAAGLDSEALPEAEARLRGLKRPCGQAHRWASFRLASRTWSHFSFSSLPAGG